MKTFLVLVFCLLVIVHVCDGSTYRSKKQIIECDRKSQECGRSCDDADDQDACIDYCDDLFDKCRESPTKEWPTSDPWTRSWSGCPCDFDKWNFNCACCNDGGCHCPLSNLHQCVQCGHVEQCGIAPPIDRWTDKASGCPCYFDKDRKDCACCNEGGCQCSLSNLHQCVQCDHGDQCGKGVPALDVGVKAQL